jgi:TolB-like protein/DNA-binding winged helix-turn-helix (wHTH) protein/Tfp pilus assembly protein PilF
MAAQPGHNAVRIGEWLADPDDDSLTRGDERLRIEPRMMRLLMRFAASPGKVLNQETLLNDVWQGVIVSSASVYQSISQLRKALGDTESPPTYIETVSRKGYRLIATVSKPGRPDDAIVPATASETVAGQHTHPRRRWYIALAGAAVLGIAAAVFWSRFAVPEVANDSIVVLPFLDLTTGKTEQPYCDGLTEELSNWLAQIPTLRVVSRTSAFEFRDRGIDVRRVGTTLGVTHVLEGSVRRSGDSQRVTVQLVTAHDGYHLWSTSYDTPIADALHVQEKIARDVAAHLELRLTADVDGRFAERQNSEPRAHRLYLIAQAHQQRRTRQENDQAIRLFRQALEIEPDYPLALVGLASAYLNQVYLDDRAVEDVARDVQPLLQAAEKRSPRLPELYAVRGGLHADLGQRESAVEDLLRALELNPNLVRAASDLGRLHILAGEPRDALRYYTQATQLQPLDSYLLAQRCMALTDLAQFDVAQAACDQARALGSGSTWALSVASDLAESRGRPAEALGFTELALQDGGDVTEIHADRGRWLMRLGLVREARAAFEEAMAATGRDDGSNLSLSALGLRTALALDGAAGLAREIETRKLSASDEPEVMFELAEAELLAGNAQAARGYVDRALASPKLRADELASAWYARNGRSYLMIAAAAERGAGDDAAAQRHIDAASRLFERMKAAGVKRHGLYVLEAQVSAMRGDADGAMRALDGAVALGFRYKWITDKEPHFDTLRGREDFRALMARVEALNAADRAGVLEIAQRRIAAQ